MATRVLFSAIVVCFALLGCKSGEIRTAAQPFDCKRGVNCEATIVSPSCSGSVCTASVDHDPLNLAHGNTNVPIDWNLPAGYKFCPALLDGVFLKDGYDGQFDDMKATDDSDENPPPKIKCYKKYHWRGLNTQYPEKRYEYRIWFHDNSGTTQYKVDPWVVNH